MSTEFSNVFGVEREQKNLKNTDEKILCGIHNLSGPGEADQV